jgi:hypothetical protein
VEQCHGVGGNSGWERRRRNGKATFTQAHHPQRQGAEPWLLPRS